MVATAPRIHLGVALPAIARAPAQAAFALEPSACLPRGYSLRETAGGLLLVGPGGEPVGIMVSVDFACRHASTLARMAATRGAGEGDA